MSFKISLDNDITYLLSEIGHNVLVNNIPAKAIVNNTTKQERTFDDKQIITHQELKRGHYVKYNDLYFLVISEVNDQRYGLYYKAIIRRCNFNIRFIINNKLYEYPSIITSENAYIADDTVMAVVKQTVKVTLPLDTVTSQLKIEDAFLKWDQKWSISGRDYTKDGLITLTVDLTGTSHNDDKENEIANRYDKDESDKLDGNIDPIYPFDDMGVDPTDPEEPDPPIEDDVTYDIEVIKQYQSDTEFKISTRGKQTYIVTKYLADTEVEALFAFSLSESVNGLTLAQKTENSCELSATTIYGQKYIDLLVLDTETEETVIIQPIHVNGI